MSKDIAVRQVGPKAAKRAILTAIQTGRPVFVWGSPGLGKSDIVSQIGQDLNREVIDVRLALWEPTDIKGIPYYNPEQGKMVWAPPSELPLDPKSTAIIFLDELNSAPPAVQAAAYQLILNRRVGTYVLPDGVSIVAAGNRDSDRGVTHRMPSPLANRFIHIEMTHDVDDWIEWATAHSIHADVVGYIGFAKQDLYDFDPRASLKAFATPRSWHFVSDLVKNPNVDSETMLTLICGAIGDGLAGKFVAHRKIAGKLPNAIDVLSGKVTTLEVQEISAKYSLTVSLCYELREQFNKLGSSDKWNSMADNFLKFIMGNFETELVIMGARTALVNFSLPLDPSKLKSFPEFHNRYAKFIQTAMAR